MLVIQLILFCLLFIGMVKFSVRNGAVNGIYFYPKPVQERAIAIGLTDWATIHRKKRRFMIPFLFILLVALLLIIGLWNGASDFKTAYWQALLFLEVMNWEVGSCHCGQPRDRGRNCRDHVSVFREGVNMKYLEYGKDNQELVVMLHGGGVSYRGVDPTVQVVAKKYHVILVAYDGFNPSEPETEFVSVQDEARRLGDYIMVIVKKTGPGLSQAKIATKYGSSKVCAPQEYGSLRA